MASVLYNNYDIYIYYVQINNKYKKVKILNKERDLNMKILVLAQEYSSKEKISQGFIHTRNLEYIKAGIIVDVISFALKNGKYNLDKINVYSEKEFYKEHNISEYNIIISHAPNIKNHCKFINRNNKKIRKIFFFFHGHEVLKTNEIYPKPYDFVKKKNILKENVRYLYDRFKLLYLTKFLKKYLSKSIYIFVSEWMYEEFKKNIKIPENEYKAKSNIIYNSLGNEFLKNTYNIGKPKIYDFITIRNMLDKSKYCVDLVYNLAIKYPKYKFLVVGKGEFFKHHKLPPNLIFESKYLNHKEITEYLDKSRFALMPTKADAQGVMMCEMATYGIPLITSDIFVCQKVLGGLKNVRFIKNDISRIDLEKTIKNLLPEKDKPERFSYKNTIKKEIELIKQQGEKNV